MFRLRTLGVGDVVYALRRRELRLASRLSQHLVGHFVNGLHFKCRRWTRRRS